MVNSSDEDSEIEDIKPINLKVHFLSSKTDKFKNDITYFLVLNKTMLKEFKNSINDESLKLPWFKKDNYILKVKTKLLNDYEFEKDTQYNYRFFFKKYDMGANHGYYICKAHIEKNI